MSAPDLSALVSARLCHDLISPIGAIGNGIELMQLSQTGNTAELDLISGSLGSALAKLRFYRIAFGPADAEGRQSFDEICAITDAMFQGRFSVTWSGGGADLPRATVRTIFLALLCLEKSLPMGGAVEAAIGAEAISLCVDGRRTAAPAALWALVTDDAPAPDLRADNVQFALLQRALAETGHRLRAAFTDSGATVSLTTTALAPA